MSKIAEQITKIVDTDSTLIGASVTQRGAKGAQSVEILDSSGNQVIPAVAGLSIPVHDYIALTYVSAGNGAGEIETVVYKDGGASGSTVATLTLAYNSDDEIQSITKT